MRGPCPRVDPTSEPDLTAGAVHTVEQIAAEFGVSRPTIYRHLARLPAETG